tara:strand:+ start:821 stop:1543 length:723 start_codon:yes stop_codon:yes gene_type:complete
MSNPYQAPQKPLSTVNSAVSNLYNYKNLGALTAITTALLLLGIFSAGVETWSSYNQLDLLNRMRSGMQYTQGEAMANDTREMAIGLAALAIYILTAIVFGIWIVRAHKNLYAFKLQRLSYTPGWALGWFFVPILNYIRPFQAMKELWQASHGGVKWDSFASANLINLWWLLWVVNSIYSTVVSRMFLSPSNIDELIIGTKASMFSVLIHIPLCLLAIKLVRGIQNAQEKLANSHAEMLNN